MDGHRASRFEIATDILGELFDGTVSAGRVLGRGSHQDVVDVAAESGLEGAGAHGGGFADGAFEFERGVFVDAVRTAPSE